MHFMIPAQCPLISVTEYIFFCVSNGLDKGASLPRTIAKIPISKLNNNKNYFFN